MGSKRKDSLRHRDLDQGPRPTLTSSLSHSRVAPPQPHHPPLGSARGGAGHWAGEAGRRYLGPRGSLGGTRGSEPRCPPQTGRLGPCWLLQTALGSLPSPGPSAGLGGDPAEGPGPRYT